MKIFVKLSGLFIAMTMLIVLGVTSANAGDDLKLRTAPLNPDYINAKPSRFGYVPPPMDLSHIKPDRESKLFVLPDSFDWRGTGTTSVKNQNPYGTCWAFAALGDLESKVLLGESGTVDLSESHIVGCNEWGANCNSGGNSLMATSVLTVRPSQLESCNGYPPSNCMFPTCNTSCPGQQYVTGWRILTDKVADVATIKNAVYNYGPVQTTLFAGDDINFTDFDEYDGSCVLEYTIPDDPPYNDPTYWPNHAVLIVGWDDYMSLPSCTTKTGSIGAWIVKNSWGTDWGDNGYFYIAYGDARIGTDSTVYTEYAPYDQYEDIYYYDQMGRVMGLGYEIFDYAWAAVRYTPVRDGKLTHVDFWATSNNTSYEISVYDDFNGKVLSNQLGVTETGGGLYAGYNSILLSTPIDVETGNEITLVIKITTPGYGWPIPATGNNNGTVQSEPYVEKNKCYISPNGFNWTYVGQGADGYDVGVRARVYAETAMGLSTRKISFSAKVDGDNPISQSFTIENTGPDIINWTATETSDWLSLTPDPATGSSTGEADTVTVSVDITGLASGTYNAEIFIEAPEAFITPKYIPIRLNVKKKSGGGDDGGGGGGGGCNRIVAGDVSKSELTSAVFLIALFAAIPFIIPRRKKRVPRK